MVQRSSTTIVKNELVHDMVIASFPEGEPTEVSDFKNTSMPWGLKRKVILETKDVIAEMHREIHEGLRSRGLDVNLDDGTGTFLKFHSNYGGRLFFFSHCLVQILMNRPYLGYCMFFPLNFTII